MAELPSGTVTFLFTDLEGSTRLWEEHPEAMHGALARHDAILRGAVVEHHGHVVKTTGDGVHAVFATAHDALNAAVAVQVELQREPWDTGVQLQVRMGLHTCEAEHREGDYFGTAVNRAARLMAVAHGGQVVCSQTTAPQLISSFTGPDGPTGRRQFVEQMFLPTDDPTRRARIIETMTAVPNDIAIPLVQAIAAFDAMAVLEQCKVPVLTISSAVPTNDAASLLAANSTMTLGQTVGAGHFLQLEVPEQVNPMIERFLAIIPGGTLAPR